VGFFGSVFAHFYLFVALFCSFLGKIWAFFTQSKFLIFCFLSFSYSTILFYNNFLSLLFSKNLLKKNIPCSLRLQESRTLFFLPKFYPNYFSIITNYYNFIKTIKKLEHIVYLLFYPNHIFRDLYHNPEMNQIQNYLIRIMDYHMHWFLLVEYVSL